MPKSLKFYLLFIFLPPTTSPSTKGCLRHAKWTKNAIRSVGKIYYLNVPTKQIRRDFSVNYIEITSFKAEEKVSAQIYFLFSLMFSTGHIQAQEEDLMSFFQPWKQFYWKAQLVQVTDCTSLRKTVIVP